MDANRFLIFYYSLNRIVKDIKRLEMSHMREYGLRSVHMGCMLSINSNEKGMSITELARACRKDKALISRTVKELLADGFIESKPTDKAYNKKYFLTEKSKDITAAINEDIIKYMEKARVGIPEEDMLEFYEVLEALESNISHIEGGVNRRRNYGT